MATLRPLINAQQISRRLDELAAQISARRGAQPLVVVGVLNGAFMLVADLVRRLTIPVVIDFLRVSSYGSATESSGVVQIRKDLDLSVAGREVLLVEDIVDTGLTASFLMTHLQLANPSSLKVCTLLDKPSRRRVHFQPDYVGFEIEDAFVVGYGLDFNDEYRQLPDVCVLQTTA